MILTRAQIVRVLPLAVTVALLMLGGGCGKDDNPVSSDDIPETNLFPFAVGRLSVYSTYSLDTTANQKITSTVHREAWFVQGTASIGGKNAFRIIDSIYTPSGTLQEVDTTYLAVENNNLLIYEGTVWVTIFDRSQGLNKEYEAGKITEETDLGPITVTLKAKILPKEAVSVPIGNLQAYKLEVKQVLVFGPINFEILQYIYIADSYGPIKFHTPAQKEPLSSVKGEGAESVLVSKNF